LRFVFDDFCVDEFGALDCDRALNELLFLAGLFGDRYIVVCLVSCLTKRKLSVFCWTATFPPVPNYQCSVLLIFEQKLTSELVHHFRTYYPRQHCAFELAAQARDERRHHSAFAHCSLLLAVVL